MSRIIGIVSAKGGVGKTTTAANLAAALAKRKVGVIAIDGNVTTPNLSLHMWVPLYPFTLHDAMKGDIDIRNAIYQHESGVKLVPASLSVEDLEDLNPEHMQRAIVSLFGNEEIIIIDGAAGLGREARATISMSDELIIVTNPELTALTDALKAIKLAEKYGTRVLGVVVNRVKGAKHEVGVGDIDKMLEVPILAVIPEDPAVPESIANKKPIVHYSPKSKAAKEFGKLASVVLGESEFIPVKKGFMQQLIRYFIK